MSTARAPEGAAGRVRHGRRVKIVIIGAGRMGEGLGRALADESRSVTLLVRSVRPVPPGLSAATGEAEWASALAAADVVVVATPDGAIASVATALGERAQLPASAVVLHLSGLLDHSVLRAAGRPAASLHPLMAVALPADAPTRLRGAVATIEGDRRAAETAWVLAEAAGMVPVEIPAAAKPAYHAGATIASNYIVALMDAAAESARSAGLSVDVATTLYLGLARGTLDNISEHGVVAALTGAIRRGDADVVRRHLAALPPGPTRLLYQSVGRYTVEIAVRGGLDHETARELRSILEG